MVKPSLRARAQGLAVVRKGTVLVAAVAVAGTGAFAALQAKAYDASHPGGGTKATGSEGLASQNVNVTHDSGEHDEGHDDREEHDDGEVAGVGSFSPPVTAPANAGGSTASVVSGGS